MGRELEAGKQTQFTLDAKEGQSIDILISSEDFDPSILIYDVAGNLLAINDNLDQNASDAGFPVIRTA